MRIFLQILWHLAVTAVGVCLIVFGILGKCVPEWVWGIVCVVGGNLIGVCLLFILGLIMVPIARHTPQETNANEEKVTHKDKKCPYCGETIPYTSLYCPKCNKKLD